MLPRTKATIYGLALSLFGPFVILLWPRKAGDAFVCLGDHLAEILAGPGQVGLHLWPQFLWPTLCLWVLSAAISVLASIGLLALWADARHEHRMTAMLTRPRPVRTSHRHQHNRPLAITQRIPTLN